MRPSSSGSSYRPSSSSSSSSPTVIRPTAPTRSSAGASTVTTTGTSVRIRPYTPPAPTSAPGTGGSAPLDRSARPSGLATTPTISIPAPSPRFRAGVPQPATSGYAAGDQRAPQFRSALERLAAGDSGPSTARLSDALRQGRSSQNDVDGLIQRYQRASADGGAPNLRGTLERLAARSAERGLSSTATASLSRTDAARVEQALAERTRRANGAPMAYERGPRWRLENPRGEQLRAAESTVESAVDRRRRADARLESHRRESAGAGGLAPGSSTDIGGRTTQPEPNEEVSLGFVDHDHDGLYDDFDQHHHHYHHHYNSWCGYGNGWWNSCYSYCFGFGFHYGYHAFKPLWLHHPVYGTYPWYGGYWLGHCGYSSWHLGSWGSWSWGFSPYYHGQHYYDDPTPDVIVVESEPEIIVIEQPVLVQPEQPVVVEQLPADLPLGPTAPVPVVDPAAEAQRLSVAADRYLTLGDRAFRDERYADAVHFYEEAIRLAPDEPVLQLLLSDALFAVGDYGSAADALRVAIVADPLLARSEVDKREFYATKRAFDRQLAVAELYLFDHPADSDARLVLAVNLLFSGAPASAVDLLEDDLAAGLRDDPVGALILDVARARQFGPIEGYEPQTLPADDAAGNAAGSSGSDG